MSISIRRTLCATAVITVSFAAGAGHVNAGGDDTPRDGDDLPFDAPGDPPPPPPDPEVNPDLDLPDLDIVNPTLPPDPPPCGAFDIAAFGVTIADNGDGTAFVQIGYFDTEDACNADVTVTSYATNVDVSASAIVATDQTTVNELEAAALGDGWFETDIAVDPCFAKVVVDVDGTELETDHFGLGCSISITKDFEGDPWNAGINVVHVDGWTPDHVFEVSSDDMVVWDELPSGDYTVSEFDGAEDGTTISIDGGPAVPHAGEPVPVTVGQSVLVTNPDLSLDETNPTAPDPDDEPEPTLPEDEPDPTVPENTQPDRDLPETGSSMTGLLTAAGLLTGLGGLGCTALARRRR